MLVLNIFFKLRIYINDKKVITTPRHQFYIVDKGWVRAYDLEEGDKIVARGGDLAITKIEHEFLDNAILVYNLNVDDFHTYLVTEYELLVHNAASPVKPDIDTIVPSN